MAYKQYQGASRSYDEIKTVRVPAIGNPFFRGTTTSSDQRFVNGFFELMTKGDPNSQSKHYHFVKRPALTQTGGIRPGAANGVGRGTYSWNGKLYSVVGTKIYSGTTDLGVTLASSTGTCGFAETRPGVVTQYLGINDGIKLYLITTGDVISTITLNFPTPNTRDLVYMDGYFFVMKSDNATIYQCDLDDPTSWDTSKFIVTQQYNGVGVGLAHQNNILIAFTDRAVTMFYDNANASGAVITLYEQAVQQIGCASQSSIAADEQSVIWVSNSQNGGYTVQKMDGIGQSKTISTSSIDRILNAETTNISGCYAFALRIAGKHFYILNLLTANQTFVYDIEENLWVEWESAVGGSVWPTVASTQHLNTLVCQHGTNGWLYVLSPTIFQDDSTSFIVLWRTSRLDFDTNGRKFVRGVDVIGDIQATTTNVSLQYSDDDYVTLSTARTVDMSSGHGFGMNFGNFRRRSWQLSYSGTNACRWEGLEFRIRLGQS